MEDDTLMPTIEQTNLLTNQSILVSVAIDIGTAFSGYAYSTKNEFKRDPLKIFTNTAWVAASGNSCMSMKTPSCLLLSSDKKFLAFGYEAEDKYVEMTEDDKHQDVYMFEGFKMALYNKQGICTVLEDITGKPVSPLTVFSESIAFFKRDFLRKLHSSGYKIKDEEIQWVLTVPAIWNDFAKIFMRKAAIQAGIPNNNLVLALEPEAASLYCQHLYTKSSDQGFGVTSPGTKFMVVDLGGGTFDITVQEKLEDGNLREIVCASGGPVGGTTVIQAFIKLLKKLIGDDVIDTFKKKQVEDYLTLVRSFEVSKRNIQFNSNTVKSFIIRVPATLSELCFEMRMRKLSDVLQDNPTFKDKIKLERDKLRFDLCVMTEIFQNVATQICQCMSNTLESAEGREVTIIQLVGGFSESKFIQEMIRDKFQTPSRRVIVPNEAGLVVLKGAVIFGHSPSSIESRILRYTYGIAIKAPFKEGVHDERKKCDDGETIWCKNIFKPFITKGTSVKVGHTFANTKKSARYETAKMKIYVTDGDDVKYVTDDGCHELCNVQFNDVLPADVTTTQKIKQMIIFGDTELHISLFNYSTKMRHNLSIKHANQ